MDYMKLVTSKMCQAGFAVLVVTILKSAGIDLPYELIYAALGTYGVVGVKQAVIAIEDKKKR